MAEKAAAPSAAAAPRRQAKAPLWKIRAPIPAGTGRLLGFIALALVFVAWCLLTYIEVQGEKGPEPLISRAFLPPPHEVLRSMIYLTTDQGLIGAVGVSALRILKAFGLSILVAVPLGIAMGSFETVNKFFDPLVAPLRYLPITAFIPLLILWFDIGETQKIAFLFLGTVVYLLPVVVDAVRAVPEEMVQTAFTLGATRGQVIRTVLIPAALPQIFDSFRVMNAIAWTYIILAEVINPQSGIGFILYLAQKFTKPAWSFAGIIVVGIVGILTDLAIRGLSRLFFPWRESDA